MQTRLRSVIISIFLILLSFVLFAANKNRSTAYLLNIQGAIGPATADFIQRGISQAAKQQGQIVILRMDTPGGLAKSMRGIIKAILAAPMPIVTYVAPSGARAASAGTYILYASHIAAMAPGTNLGAATPVSIGGGGSLPGMNKKNKQNATKQSTLKQKVTNDAIAYIRSLAQLRGRNIDWAVKFVKQAKSMTAQEALKENVIDLMASNLSQLLTQLNGRKVNIQGREIILNTKHMLIKTIQPDWRVKFLSIITDPSVAYILLLLGIYGLFFEFANPGFIAPGVIGAICLMIALYAFQLLPISYAGLGLILLGIIFMVMEAFIPSFGAFGIGGVIAFVVGSILLLDSDLPGYSIAWPLIISMALVNAGFFFIIFTMAIRARRRKVVSGAEQLLNESAIVINDFTQQGSVRVHGEIWQARCQTPVKKGEVVRIIKLKGLCLEVEQIKEER